jgi:REP element-mobilizing transposase RayT
MVQTVWEDLPGRFPDIELDEIIIMPNHIHGIIVIVGAPLVGARGDGAGSGKKRTDEDKKRADTDKDRADTRPAPTNAKPTLGDIVCAYKSLTTDQYILGVENQNWPPFPGRLWQRNYYEHIIRNEKSLDKIREYIIQNSKRWEYDMENTGGKPDGVERDFWKVFGQERK